MASSMRTTRRAWLLALEADNHVRERGPVPPLNDVSRENLQARAILRSGGKMLDQASTESTADAGTLEALTSVVTEFSAVAKGLRAEVDESVRSSIDLADPVADVDESRRGGSALEPAVGRAITGACARLTALLETVLGLDHQLAETSVEQFLNAYGPNDGASSGT